MINYDKIKGSIARQGDVSGTVASNSHISGAVSMSGKKGSDNVVQYVEQSLTDEQAAQARKNIKTAGESVEGATYIPYTVEEIDGYNYNFHYEEPVVAQEGAEIFNDYNNIAAGLWSTASGYETQALGNYSVTSGWWTRADGQCAHAEGLLTRASGHFAHAEGTRTKATINNAHAEGDLTQATGRQAHSEGVQTIASGYCAHAEGSNTKATNYYSHAEGLGTIAAGRNQTAMGKYNISDTKSLVIVGNGSKDTTRSNAYKLDANGNGWFEGTVASTGADYAEYFEWLDGNPDGEDRIGRVVTLEGEKIRYANAGEYILGVISGTALILGDNPGDEWKDKFLKDKYGRFLTETVEDFIEYYDYETGENVVESTGFVTRKVLNPAFNPDDEYITRKERNEWEIVGMMGKLHVIDDGTCVPNGYARVSHDGIVTHSDTVTTMRVMERLSDNIILILKKTANDHEPTVNEEQVTALVNELFEEGKASGEFTGPKGDKGDPGRDGKTPVKGKDYFTEEDKTEIAEQAAQMVELPDGGSYVVSDTAPEDTSVLWIDTSDDSDDVEPVTNAVLYTKQTLTEEQKAQARENIGAANAEDIISGNGLTTEEKNLIFSLFKDAAYTKPLGGAIEQLAELWGISLVWQKVIPLEKIMMGYGLTSSRGEINGEYKHGIVRDNRASYIDFIPIKAGATYKFEWDGSVDSLICIEAYNTTAMNAVSGGWSFTDNDRWSSGWNNNQTTGCQITIPTEYNGSPVLAMRFTFKSSAPPTGDITITEVVD